MTQSRISAQDQTAVRVGTLISGAGNRFVLLDARSAGAPSHPAVLARKLCARPVSPISPLSTGRTGSDRVQADGLLLLVAAETDAALKLHVYNANGSKPEACGNGLRCVGYFLAREGVRGSIAIETDAGLRRLEIDDLANQDGTHVRACLDVPRILHAELHLALTTHELRATHVDVGNPHCVVLVEDERCAPVDAWGREIERNRHFPGRTNVEFVALRAGKLFARVWERGVGETEACGTGACAIATALAPRLGLEFPLSVNMPGGELRVDRDADGALWISGKVEELGEIPIPRATGG